MSCSEASRGECGEFVISITDKGNKGKMSGGAQAKGRARRSPQRAPQRAEGSGERAQPKEQVHKGLEQGFYLESITKRNQT